ncbi:hypothetical protein [Sphingomonas sp.]|uniref:hypothetical protein n=1 Tax=Sphingomonas sp. TaxID=28214 RepID=UPI0031D5E5F8
MQRDDDMFVLLALLKIGAVLVLQVADRVEAQQHIFGDLYDMHDRHFNALARLLAGEREALLNKWGDILGLEQMIADMLAAHHTALAKGVSNFARLIKALDQRVETLRPLLDLLRSPDGSGFSPTRLVLDEIGKAIAAGISEVRGEQSTRRWFRALICGYRITMVAGISAMLYRVWT